MDFRLIMGLPLLEWELSECAVPRAWGRERLDCQTPLRKARISALMTSA